MQAQDNSLEVEKKKKCCNYQLRTDWAIMSKWPEEKIKGILTKDESAKWVSSWSTFLETGLRGNYRNQRS